jgi:hypothetical protein
MHCNASFINNSSYDRVSDTEALYLSANYFQPGAMNVHIVNRMNGAGAYYPIANSVFLASAVYDGRGAASTFAHEAGHFLGLDHTHQYTHFPATKCFKEPIDRNRTFAFINICGSRKGRRCESTGDALCDTPADPDLSNFISPNSCIYVGTATDDYGDRYDMPPTGSFRPDVTNLMSYGSPRACREIFTRQQVAVMVYAIERGRQKTDREGWKSDITVFDSYEPDNTFRLSRRLNLNETQQRTLHFTYQGKSTTVSSPNYSSCGEED